MREIKFRAWELSMKNKTIVNNKMIPWEELLKFYNLKNILDDNELRNEFVLMQYTGLKDKNCKEIYEGDIVKYQSIYDEQGVFRIGEVIFDLGMFTVKGVIKWLGTDCEIIGDIYENPELLEVE